MAIKGKANPFSKEKKKPNTKNHTAMWAVSYLPPPTPPCHPLVRNGNKPPFNLKSPSFSAKSQPPGQDLGGLGHSILTKLKSNHKPTTPILSKQKQKQRQNQGGKQMISGSDVLFALQKSADKKSREVGKKKKKANVSLSSSSSSAGNHREEEGVDEDGKVRPLCVKSEWGDRLDELEKRFQELSSKVI